MVGDHTILSIISSSAGQTSSYACAQPTRNLFGPAGLRTSEAMQNRASIPPCTPHNGGSIASACKILDSRPFYKPKPSLERAQTLNPKPQTLNPKPPLSSTGLGVLLGCFAWPSASASPTELMGLQGRKAARKDLLRGCSGRVV